MSDSRQFTPRQAQVILGHIARDVAKIEDTALALQRRVPEAHVSFESLLEEVRELGEQMRYQVELRTKWAS